MTVPRIELPAAPKITLIQKNTTIPEHAKQLLVKHRDLLATFRRGASLQTALHDVLEYFVARGERLPHLYGGLTDGGPQTGFTAGLVRAHWDWVEDMRDLFSRREGKRPSVGDILASSFELCLPADKPLALPRRYGPRESSGPSEGDDP